MTRDLETGRWRLRRLFEAPHRLAFGAAALVLALSALWWAAGLPGEAQAGRSLPWALPPATAHGLIMAFGFMPLYFSGFLFTAGPKWLSMPAPSARDLLPALLPQVAGWLLFLIAARGRDAAFGQVIGAIALTAVVLGWSRVALRFLRLMAAGAAGDRLHAGFVALACAAGVVALVAAAVGVARGDFMLVRAATHGGLWGFTGLMFVTALHRLVPFFSAAVPSLDARRPAWLIWALGALLGFEAMAQALYAFVPDPSAAWRGTRAMVEVAGGLGVLALCLRWARLQPLSLRLLAMLHVGFTWLGLALLLSGVDQALAVAGNAPAGFALASTHAFTMGFLGSTLLAMVTRVSCAQGGRTVAADDVVWRLFWVLQLAIVARLGAAFVGPLSTELGQALVGAAATGWAGVCIAWAVRCSRWYGLPRAEHRKG
jgi:uncharacterized protein involved in response to NO